MRGRRFARDVGAAIGFQFVWQTVISNPHFGDAGRFRTSIVDFERERVLIHHHRFAIECIGADHFGIGDVLSQLVKRRSIATDLFQYIERSGRNAGSAAIRVK